MIKKLLSLGLAASTVLSNPSESHSENKDSNEYIKYTIEEKKPVDIVVRAGEWGNEHQVKAGKRVYVNPNTINIPNDITIRVDENGHYISEFDINKKMSSKLHSKLQEKGINSKLQIATSPEQDLNSAGKIANADNPKMYFSLHTNAHKSDSTGFFFMYNEGDYDSESIANELSECIKNKGFVPQSKNRVNERGYIGELKMIEGDTIAILGEMGFYTNLEELENIMSDEYADVISEEISNELVDILK